MTKHPTTTVSAVIATRNRPALLRRAIDAMQNQGDERLVEIVVVYDQSDPDETLTEQPGPVPVRVIANDHQPGLAGARNTGITAAAGDWVAFCDDDDVWQPHKLARQLDVAAADPDVDFLVGSVTIAYGEKRISRTCGLQTITLRDLLRDRVMAAHPSTYLVRRSAIDEYIGLVDEDLPGSYAEDYDWILRAARVEPIRVVDDAVTLVEWHTDSYFGQRWQMIDDALDYLVEKTPEFADEPRGLARIMGQRAFAQAAMGNTRESMQTAWQTVRVDWREVRPYITMVVWSRIVSADRLMKFYNATGRGF